MIDLFQFLDLILPPKDSKSIGEYTELDRMHFRLPLFPCALILSISRAPMAVPHLTGIEVLLNYKNHRAKDQKTERSTESSSEAG
jgi:hypothetical protein